MSSVKGNPVRLAPVTMTLRTDSVKKSYYHGEKLELNGLEVITERLPKTEKLKSSVRFVEMYFLLKSFQKHPVSRSLQHLIPTTAK